MSLILGGVSVPLIAALDLSQSYEPIGGVSTLRTLNGTAVRRQHWQKLRTSISGGGWIPAGLQALDYSGALSLSCIAPRSVHSANVNATLPAARRSDAGYLPYAHAVLADGQLVDTAVSLVGNAATATAVTGAAAYLFHYYPVLSVLADPPAEEFDRSAGSFTWSLSAEEV